MATPSNCAARGQRALIVNAAYATAKLAAGKPYKLGGTTPDAFDCSGFVRYVFCKVFPHFPTLDAVQMASSPLFEKIARPQPGDLIFFPKGVNPYDGKHYPDHIGIVLDSNNWMSSQTSTGVAPVTMSQVWWRGRAKQFLHYRAITN